MKRRSFFALVGAMFGAKSISAQDPYADLLLTGPPKVTVHGLLSTRARRNSQGAQWHRTTFLTENEIRRLMDEIEELREQQLYLLSEPPSECTIEEVRENFPGIGPAYTSGLVPLDCPGNGWRARAVGARRRPLAARRRRW